MIILEGLRDYFQVLREASSPDQEPNHAVAMLEVLTANAPLIAEVSLLCVALPNLLSLPEGHPLKNPAIAIMGLTAITLAAASAGGSLARRVFYD